ncbi:MAG: hypothetical protein OEW56_14220, partial [Gemmatimonadota bacterium]|nr:hypothetical protein [Gemmatimonadota bacterium]
MQAHLLFTTFAVALAIGCGDSPGTTSDRGATRDSAGITIVENAMPAWTAEDAWTVAAEPALVLGVDEGDPDHEFFQITGVTRLSDGTIVVANSGTQQLRYYDPDGTLRTSAGRKGGGPGEFQMLMTLLGVPGDSLLTFDAMNRRFSVFDADGRHMRDFGTTDASSPVPILVIGRLDDGTYIGQQPNVRVGPEMFARKEGPARDSVYVLHVDASGIPADTFGLFPGPRVEVQMFEFAGRSVPMPVMVPFSPGTAIAVAPGTVYLGVSDTYEIGAYTPSGRLTRLVRRAYEPRKVTQAEIETNRASMADVMADQSNPFVQQFRDAYASIQYPETMPAYGELETDADGNLWVSTSLGTPDEARRWSIFGPEGRWLGDVTTPPRLVVREIGTDYILGHSTDEMEIERV